MSSIKWIPHHQERTAFLVDHKLYSQLLAELAQILYSYACQLEVSSTASESSHRDLPNPKEVRR